MKSFIKWYHENENTKSVTLEQAYNAGAEEARKEMMEFAEWGSQRDMDNSGDKTNAELFDSIEEALAHWKANVKKESSN